MVGVLFIGRLGNQMFQYVFLQYLKEKHPDRTFFFPNPHHSYLAKYFELGWEGTLLNSKLYSGLTRIIPRLFSYKKVWPQNFIMPRDPVVKDKTIICGYYQTDFFIRNMKQKPVLQIKEKWQAAFRSQFATIFDHHKTVAVHIRRTDYLNYGKRDISLPISYFRQQLDSIPDRDKCKIIFISDDIAYVKEQFGKADNYIFSENAEIIDFQIIQQADIAIISNSTFAWWAAYLSPKQNLVLAPKNWLGFRIGREHPRGVMTEKFSWQPVAL